ncbi:MAG TPA: hypothetical protein VJ596_11565, partial [Gemmatimonadaceae bacterium]|nr:hypothetical protein [Gemmatimonadaceae bacterium]
MRAVATGVLNMGLRGLTLVSKFLLLLGLARYLAPEELGVYGVFVGTVGIAVYVLGFDIYVYNTREILAQEERHRPAIIRDQAIFHLLAYAVTLPLLLGVFVGGFLAWRYAALFYIVLIFEHLSQEAYRLLLVLSRPIAANMLLFVRAGAWVLPVLLAVFWASDLRRIEVVLAAWAVGAAASVGLATVLLSRLEWRTVRETPIAWHAMQRAALGSVP